MYILYIMDIVQTQKRVFSVKACEPPFCGNFFIFFCLYNLCSILLHSIIYLLTDLFLRPRLPSSGWQSHTTRATVKTNKR